MVLQDIRNTLEPEAKSVPVRKMRRCRRRAIEIVGNKDEKPQDASSNGRPQGARSETSVVNDRLNIPLFEHIQVALAGPQKTDPPSVPPLSSEADACKSLGAVPSSHRDASGIGTFEMLAQETSMSSLVRDCDSKNISSFCSVSLNKLGEEAAEPKDNNTSETDERIIKSVSCTPDLDPQSSSDNSSGVLPTLLSPFSITTAQDSEQVTAEKVQCFYQSEHGEYPSPLFEAHGNGPDYFAKDDFTLVSEKYEVKTNSLSLESMSCDKEGVTMNNTLSSESLKNTDTPQMDILVNETNNNLKLNIGHPTDPSPPHTASEYLGYETIVSVTERPNNQTRKSQTRRVRRPKKVLSSVCTAQLTDLSPLQTPNLNLSSVCESIASVPEPPNQIRKSQMRRVRRPKKVPPSVCTAQVTDPPALQTASVDLGYESIVSITHRPNQIRKSQTRRVRRPKKVPPSVCTAQVTDPPALQTASVDLGYESIVSITHRPNQIRKSQTRRVRRPKKVPPSVCTAQVTESMAVEYYSPTGECGRESETRATPTDQPIEELTIHLRSTEGAAVEPASSSQLKSERFQQENVIDQTDIETVGPVSDPAPSPETPLSLECSGQSQSELLWCKSISPSSSTSPAQQIQFDLQFDDDNLPTRRERRRSRSFQLPSFDPMSNNEVHQSLPVGPDLPAVQQQELRDTAATQSDLASLDPCEFMDFDLPEVLPRFSRPLKKHKCRRRSADIDIINTVINLSPEVDLLDLRNLPDPPAGSRRSRRLRRKSLDLYRESFGKLKESMETEEDVDMQVAMTDECSEETLAKEVGCTITETLTEALDWMSGESANLASHETDNQKTIDDLEAAATSQTEQGLSSRRLRRTAKSSDSAPSSSVCAQTSITDSDMDKTKAKRATKRKSQPSLEDIYLNKLWRSQMPKQKVWETIFEVPRDSRLGSEYMSQKKFKRHLNFDEFFATVRLKRRRKKAVKQGWKPITEKREQHLGEVLEKSMSYMDQQMNMPDPEQSQKHEKTATSVTEKQNFTSLVTERMWETIPCVVENKDEDDERDEYFTPFASSSDLLEFGTSSGHVFGHKPSGCGVSDSGGSDLSVYETPTAEMAASPICRPEQIASNL